MSTKNSTKISITLDGDILDFVNERARSNRSGYINSILAQEKRRIFMQELEEAYQQQSEDSDFQAEISEWDVTVGDSL